MEPLVEIWRMWRRQQEVIKPHSGASKYQALCVCTGVTPRKLALTPIWVSSHFLAPLLPTLPGLFLQTVSHPSTPASKSAAAMAAHCSGSPVWLSRLPLTPSLRARRDAPHSLFSSSYTSRPLARPTQPGRVFAQCTMARKRNLRPISAPGSHMVERGTCMNRQLWPLSTSVSLSFLIGQRESANVWSHGEEGRWLMEGSGLHPRHWLQW